LGEESAVVHEHDLAVLRLQAVDETRPPGETPFGGVSTTGLVLALDVGGRQDDELAGLEHLLGRRSRTQQGGRDTDGHDGGDEPRGERLHVSGVSWVGLDPGQGDRRGKVVSLRSPFSTVNSSCREALPPGTGPRGAGPGDVQSQGVPAAAGGAFFTYRSIQSRALAQ